MDTKTRILQILERNRGKVFSGEQLAEKTGVTRAAVWKAVKALVAGGCRIEAVRGGGYTLSEDTDALSATSIRACLPERYSSLPVTVAQEVSSTNILAQQAASEGAPHGTVVAAVRQSAGQGRVGKSFCSPDGGIYFSIVLRLGSGIERAPLITLAAAVAVMRSLKRVLGIDASVKWVNDVFLNGKKICGISAQAQTDFFSSAALRSVVVGIGINYSTPQSAFSEELRNIAGTIYGDGSAPPKRNELVADIVSELLDLSADLENAAFLDEYRSRCFVIGRRVSYVYEGTPETAVAKTVGDDGALIVKTDGGIVRALKGEEISVRPL